MHTLTKKVFLIAVMITISYVCQANQDINVNYQTEAGKPVTTIQMTYNYIELSKAQMKHLLIMHILAAQDIADKLEGRFTQHCQKQKVRNIYKSLAQAIGQAGQVFE